MRLKRHSELQRQSDRALDAVKRGEWWDGKRWRAHDELPSTEAEASAYKTALDVLAELNQAMIGDGIADGPARIRAVKRLAQSFKARYSQKTKRERDSLTAWDVLVSVHGKEMMLSPREDKAFLIECADVLEAHEVPAPRGGDEWYNKSMVRVRDLIRRHRKRLQPLH